jgi:hypothetical protein
MTEPLRANLHQDAEALEAAVRDALAACDGDMLATLKAALVANSFLMAEVEELNRAVSFGCAASHPGRLAAEKLETGGKSPRVSASMFVSAALAWELQLTK